MPIQYINVGTIANDGTGDDLREAMIKINDNFEELDSRIVEETVIENAGTFGDGVYIGKNDQGIHELKRLVGGTNVSLNVGATTISIDAADSIGQLIVGSDSGTVYVTNAENTLNVRGGTGIDVIKNGAANELLVNLGDRNILQNDTLPQLGGDLDANFKNIVGANTVTATTFRGSFEGNIWGYDVRTFGSYFQGFDFGAFRNQYNSSIEFIMARVDLDFGAITPEGGDTVDLGYIV
jgi:hypothetical protein